MPSTAEEFVAARREARALAGFPGELPASLSAAYAVQEEVLRLTPRRLAGWKVAGIPPAFRERYDAPRLVGPVFTDAVQDVADGGSVDVFVYAGGFAAIEAEFVVRLTADAPERPVAAADIPGFATLHAGSEIASSPLASINDLGPGAVIADHGNNAGALIGPAIPPGATGDWERLVSRTLIGGVLAGEGNAARVAGGPYESVAFLIAQLASRGRSLKAGDIVLTGMTTGVHDVRVGEEARIEFPGVGGFDLRVVAREPQTIAGDQSVLV
ncbi:fumarylacetoacetate hydrolase family protein [Ancylobacter sp. Lp-2]|uniref:2-keto-4-pentenoate hydratase n=1 Tax=Ancylobacter sp. Lp-2 TaxID=2881339 RepID=UPI001E4BBF7A|nr:fumarylacetoacetate hydrolase family protein [Ancylobacter sp. Lp-2]MCB4771883.1 fumarylacetoacetate hydrolase family protein [Ancylobacter sp. Lp-2]